MNIFMSLLDGYFNQSFYIYSQSNKLLVNRALSSDEKLIIKCMDVSQHYLISTDNIISKRLYIDDQFNYDKILIFHNWVETLLPVNAYRQGKLLIFQHKALLVYYKTLRRCLVSQELNDYSSMCEVTWL